MLQYKDQSQEEWTSVSLENETLATSYTIADLTNGVEYGVRVEAVNVGGSSGWSTTETATPYDTPVTTVPGVSVVTLAAGDGSVDVSWSEPADNDAAIVSYEIRYRMVDDVDWSDWPHDGLSRTATISGLEDNTDYKVQVRASNAAGFGEWSNVVRVRTNPQPTRLPSQGNTGGGSVPVRPTPMSVPSDRDYFLDDTGNTHGHNINLIAREGITAGCDEIRRLYCPDDNVTRAQMAVFLIRALGEKLDTEMLTTGSYDLNVNDRHAGFVTTLVRLGITKGFEDGTFRPEMPVTRAQMATFLVRALASLSPADLIGCVSQM